MARHPSTCDTEIPADLSWNPTGDTEKDAYGRIVFVTSWAQQWKEDGFTPLKGPEPGSPLDADKLPHVDAYSYASLLIQDATEHLAYLAEGIKPGEDDRADEWTIRVYPSAQHTVVRSTAMTASIAVWLLAPAARKERRSRCLRYRLEDLRQLKNELGEVREFINTRSSGEQQTQYQQSLTTIETRVTQLKDLATEHGLNISSTWNNTDIIKEACLQISPS